MQTPDQPILRDIVLVGGGHSHVGVLKSFGMRPIPGVRLTVICSDTHTPYSGMLPGYVAGHYGYDETHLDLSRLAQFGQSRLYRAEVIGIDRANKKVICRNRPPVPYDVLSINIGSTPQMQSVAGADAFAVPVKPIAQFNQRWLALLQRVRQAPPVSAAKLVVAVVGAGAGGVELCLAMQYRLRQELSALGRSPDSLSFHLYNQGAVILPTHNPAVQARFMKVLRERGVRVHLNAQVNQISLAPVLNADPNDTAQHRRSLVQVLHGDNLEADEVMWVTRAGGAPWLQSTGLELDEQGFIRVNDYLQSVNDANVFAAGDVASMLNHPLEKAGVFAVRQGKPLTENLRRVVTGQPLQGYHPQRRWLALISTGDKFAVASRGALGFQGAWVWKWKDWIDQRFMRKFSEFPDMATRQLDAPKYSGPPVKLDREEEQQAISAIAMRCGGCGAKVGSTVLSRALAAINPIEREEVLIGLHSPDDAAVVKVKPWSIPSIFSAPLSMILMSSVRWQPIMRSAIYGRWGPRLSRPPRLPRFLPDSRRRWKIRCFK
jgi:selenide, water dikinase